MKVHDDDGKLVAGEPADGGNPRRLPHVTDVNNATSQ
jgi:hypothetical protein